MFSGFMLIIRFSKTTFDSFIRYLFVLFSMGIEKIVEYVSGAVVICVAGAGLYFVINPVIESARIKKEYIQTYQQALFQYADTNKDRLISASEKDEFDRRLLSDKGVTLIPENMPKYKDGRTVPTEVVTEWIRHYQPPE